VSTDRSAGSATQQPERLLLARAVALATANAGSGRLPFGALVVRDGAVLGEGVNTAVGDDDPTAHAEVAAIRAACRALATLDLAGATVVSSCEPCPMCESVARLVGIDRIVHAAPKESAAAAGLVLAPPAAALQAALRSAGIGIAEHVPTPGAEEPFARYRSWLAASTPDSTRLPRGTPRQAAGASPVSELRLALTVEDYPGALAFYRDAFGLPVVEAWATERGAGTILDAGRATLELLSADQADYIDEVEVGRRVAGPVRVALEVSDSAATADVLEAAGAERLAGPVVTPWNHANARLVAPDGMQLTLFTVLPEEAAGE
jgi:tRNA(Arg) A34 adenosine deaminase TadA/catechol 2,3-dioxygenase-like lactoylglutathione lyase family enzyme